MKRRNFLKFLAAVVLAPVAKIGGIHRVSTGAWGFPLEFPAFFTSRKSRGEPSQKKKTYIPGVLR